jgi:predicted CoA-substrate-specific enzyme activase
MFRVNVGLDVGSTFTKVCLLTEKKKILKLDIFPSPPDQKTYFCRYLTRLRGSYNIISIVSCGYGRLNCGSDKQISELSALARGLFTVCPDVCTVLDIGGQDTKALRCENGKVKQFILNDQCAAGSGLFLQNALRILEIDFTELKVTDLSAEPLTTVCAVFAQTEIIRAIAAGKNRWELAQSILKTIVKQAVGLLKQIDSKDTFVITGGLATIPGIDKVFEKLTNQKAITPKHSQFLACIGCV